MARFNTTQTFLHGQQQIVVQRREWLSGFTMFVILVVLAILGGLFILYGSYRLGAWDAGRVITTPTVITTPAPPASSKGGRRGGAIKRPPPPPPVSPVPPASVPTVIKLEVEPIQIQVQMTAPPPSPTWPDLPPNKW